MDAPLIFFQKIGAQTHGLTPIADASQKFDLSPPKSYTETPHVNYSPMWHMTRELL